MKLKRYESIFKEADDGTGEVLSYEEFTHQLSPGQKYQINKDIYEIIYSEPIYVNKPRGGTMPSKTKVKIIYKKNGVKKSEIMHKSKINNLFSYKNLIK